MAGTTSAERGRQARQQLLMAAAELIGELGWSAVSTRQVAMRAGVGPGVVHYHFPSVQALLTDAALGVIGQMVEQVLPALRQATTPADGADLLLSALDGFTGTDPESLLFSETYLAATRDEHLRASLAQIVDAFRDDVAGWLGGVGEADPAGTAATLLAVMDGFVLHKALNPALTTTLIRPAMHRLLQHGATSA